MRNSNTRTTMKTYWDAGNGGECNPGLHPPERNKKGATTSVRYVNSRGVHQYLSDNVNAFLLGTSNATTG